MDPDDKKVKIDRFYLKKIVTGTIRGDQSSSCSYNISLLILDLFPSRSSFYFILSCFFHLHPPRVDQIVGVDSYPISTFLKFLGSSCKAKNYYSSITFSLIRSESQLQSIQYGGISFFLDIIWLPFVLCFQDVYPYQQSLQNIALDGRPHCRSSALLSRGSIHLRTTFLDSYDQTSPLHLLTRTPITVIYLSSDYLMSSDWASDPIYT